MLFESKNQFIPFKSDDPKDGPFNKLNNILIFLVEYYNLDFKYPKFYYHKKQKYYTEQFNSIYSLPMDKSQKYDQSFIFTTKYIVNSTWPFSFSINLLSLQLYFFFQAKQKFSLSRTYWSSKEKWTQYLV
jgi:hypothetical protein